MPTNKISDMFKRRHIQSIDRTMKNMYKLHWRESYTIQICVRALSFWKTAPGCYWNQCTTWLWATERLRHIDDYSWGYTQFLASAISNSASNHHVWHSSSIALYDALPKVAFNGLVSNSYAAKSVPQIKEGYIGRSRCPCRQIRRSR